MSNVDDPNSSVKRFSPEAPQPVIQPASVVPPASTPQPISPKPKPSLLSNKMIIAIAAAGAAVIIVVVVVVCCVCIKKKDDEVAEVEDAWTEPYKKSKEFVSKLSLNEKLNLLYGTENCYFSEEERKLKYCVGQIDAFSNSDVSFPGMCLQDGPQGLRQMKGTAISWQASINTAATFNKDLIYKIGKAQGEECKEKGVNTLLSPSVNIMRTPQAGRLWEGYGEDPFYVGICASKIAKGIQDAGVIATIKHFTGNDQETYRKSSSSNIGTQALFDVYVEPFYRSIKDSNVASFMCAYNALNGTKTCKNKYLLTEVLRNMLGFKGFVMTDWWAVMSNTTDTINAGLELNMPGGKAWGTQYFGREGSYWQNFSTEVKNGKITEDRVTEAVTRILSSMYLLNQMENFPIKNLTVDTVTDERVALQRQAATESQVLLKNDGILPIKTPTSKKTIAVIGNAAFPRDCENGDSDHQCYNNTNHVSNGHIPIGYGSGTTDFKYLVTPLEGITNMAELKGYDVISSGQMFYTIDEIDVYGTKYNASVSAEEDIETGVETAKKADIVIVYVCSNSGEKYLSLETSKGDRGDLDAWHKGNKLVNEIVAVNQNVIVVINAPAVINVPWLDKVRAVIFSGFPGMESGNAIADVLFGEVNPSGHLPYVWGKIDEYGIPVIGLADGDDNSDLMKTYTYDEGLYVGQRWFNKYDQTATFPFGFGLSYTTFEYSDLSLVMNSTGLLATFYVKNNGTVPGSAVPMMFLTFPSYIGDYPEYIFKGFEKVEIKSGEKQKVQIFADEHALSYFDVSKNNYVRVNSGVIKVYIAENGDKNQAILKGEINASY